MLRIDIDMDGFDPADVERCVEILRAGGIGVVPTDTVYGIAARADDVRAVARVLEIKRRSAEKPLPVQVASVEDANALGRADTPAVAALASRFWPGALTIVMERRPDTRLAFQGPDTIGLRVPDSPFCIELLRRAGCLVVPSANLPGAPAPVGPGGVAPEVLGSVDFLVDAGECPLALESTVVDATGAGEVLREGAIPAGDVLSVLRVAP